MFGVTFTQKSISKWGVNDQSGAQIGTINIFPESAVIVVRNAARTVRDPDLTTAQAIAVGLAYFTRDDE